MDNSAAFNALEKYCSFLCSMPKNMAEDTMIGRPVLVVDGFKLTIEHYENEFSWGFVVKTDGDYPIEADVLLYFDDSEKFSYEI